MDESVKLLMTFLTRGGSKVSLSVDSPRDDIQESEIKDTMDLVVEKAIFSPGGDTIIEAVSAKVVQTQTTEFDLVV